MIRYGRIAYSLCEIFNWFCLFWCVIGNVLTRRIYGEPPGIQFHLVQCEHCLEMRVSVPEVGSS